MILTSGNATTRDWTKRYTTNAFGEELRDRPVFITEIYGTMDLIRKGESATLAFMVYTEPGGGFATINVSLMQNGSKQNFFSDNKVLIRLSSGKVFEIPSERNYGGLNGTLWLGCTPEYSLKLLDILNRGNFTISITSVNRDFGDTMRAVFNVGNQTTGITQLIAPIMGLKGAKSVSSKKLTFKGKIGGKYSITVQFDQPKSVFENGGRLTGTYWYGKGSNGKMKLKGSVDGLGRIDMEEYDPQGKRCGDWFLNTLSSDDGMKYELEGVMTNAKGQTFNVILTQQ